MEWTIWCEKREFMTNLTWCFFRFDEWHVIIDLCNSDFEVLLSRTNLTLRCGYSNFDIPSHFVECFSVFRLVDIHNFLVTQNDERNSELFSSLTKLTSPKYFAIFLQNEFCWTNYKEMTFFTKDHSKISVVIQKETILVVVYQIRININVPIILENRFIGRFKLLLPSEKILTSKIISFLSETLYFYSIIIQEL